MADLLGKLAADELCEKIEKDLKEYKNSDYYKGRLPHLAIVRVGNRADDIYYENSAIKKIEKLGMEAVPHVFDAKISNEDFKIELKKINDDENVDGILLFAPLPKTLNEKELVELIDKDKDVDGLNSKNQSLLYSGVGEGFPPCTADAVLQILKYANINLVGKNVVVLGRSTVIGKPVSMLLLNEDATVTICHSKTKNLREITKKADILVVAIGKAKMIDDTYVQKGAIVIDVGINEDEDKKNVWRCRL